MSHTRSPIVPRSLAGHACIASVSLLFIFTLGCLVQTTALAAGRIQWETCYDQWSWDDADQMEVRLSETTSQVGLALDLSHSLRLQVKTGFASAVLTHTPPAGLEQERTLSGFLDTRARLAYRVGDRWLFRLGINGPTGMTELETEDFTLAQALSARILAFEGHRLGQGLDLDAGISYAFPLGSATCGLGAGYLAKGAYTVREDDSEYSPGNQVTLAAGIDFSNPRWLWRTNSRAVLYQSDEYDARTIYETGDRYEAQTLLLRRWHGTSIWVSATYLTFGQAKIRQSAGLVEETDRTHGDEFYLDSGLKRAISPVASLRVSAGIRIFAGNDVGQDAARRVDLGLGCNWRLARKIAADLQGRYGFGRLKEVTPELDNEADSTLRGLRLKAALSYDL